MAHVCRFLAHFFRIQGALLELTGNLCVFCSKMAYQLANELPDMLSPEETP